LNYYRRYVGDYLRDTARLSMLDHGAYCLLLDYYYSEEEPLPADRQEIYTMVRAMTPEHRKSVDKILDRYFELADDGYHNNRADEELGVATAVIETSRENGKKGGRPKTQKQTRNETQTETQNITQTKTGKVTRDEPANNHPPTTNHQPPASSLQPPASSQSGGGVDASSSAREPQKAPPPLPEKDSKTVEKAELTEGPAVDLARHLQSLEVGIAENDARLDAWIAKGMTLATADEAAAKARTRKGRGSGPIPLNLIALIIDDLLDPAASSKGNWWATEEGIEAKATELGVKAVAGEDWEQFKNRIHTAIRKAA